eukprot:TRINITY_DN26743_c0_g1_i1.p1 TRINITY_DN26743_c0_g1~~TRINITY_DN26743_c0_g1_i1.p1  ORF type:complete len:224 (-),score=71.81 TRINITY_DN26743_c0_g1_i1:157-828(-)
MIEKLARKEREVIGKNVLWLEGASCIPDNTAGWQLCYRIRADPAWQWFMLGVNLVNVFGLMSQDTRCDPGSCSNEYQDIALPVVDIVANVLFTLDMVISMVVLGFKSYFKDHFNKLDFFVVLTGWLDVAELGLIDFSAFRAMRVLRPMRLVKYFKGIQAILGAIYYNIELIVNVTSFMVFFLTIFGIAGITLFPGQLKARCVVGASYPSNTPGISYDLSLIHI